MCSCVQYRLVARQRGGASLSGPAARWYLFSRVLSCYLVPAGSAHASRLGVVCCRCVWVYVIRKFVASSSCEPCAPVTETVSRACPAWEIGGCSANSFRCVRDLLLPWLPSNQLIDCDGAAITDLVAVFSLLFFRTHTHTRTNQSTQANVVLYIYSRMYMYIYTFIYYFSHILSIDFNSLSLLLALSFRSLTWFVFCRLLLLLLLNSDV